MDILTVSVFISIAVFFFTIWRSDITRKIKKINDLLNIDRSICDFINTLHGWEISPTKSDGLRMVITPIGFPKYYLYITYNKNRPENKDILKLYHALTDEDSIVTKAHKMNVPVEQLFNDSQIRNEVNARNNNEGNSMLRDENYVGKAMLCAMRMIANEKAHYQKIGLTDLIPILEKPIAIIDRLALIYAVLTVMSKKAINKNAYINLLIANGYISFSTDNEIIRFDERIEYFMSEIRVEMQCSSFCPGAIINTLEHPDEAPTRDLGDAFTPEVLTHWFIIIKTISEYFNY